MAEIKKIASITLCTATAVFLITLLGIAGANKDKQGEANGRAWESSDVMAGFAITGILLGLLFCAAGVAIMFYIKFCTYFMAAFWSVYALSMFFISASFGIYCNVNYASGGNMPDLWKAEIAFSVFSVVLLTASNIMCTLCTMVLRTAAAV